MSHHQAISRAGLATLFATLAILLLAALAGGARAATVTVAPGDTLSAIAARHGTSVAAIASANGIADPGRIRAGARLSVPAGGPGGAVPAGMTPVGTAPAGMTPAGATYTVRSGDTLAAIAARHGTSVGAIAGANGIADPGMIRAGARLAIPAGGAPAAAPAGTAAPSGGGYTVRPGDTLGAIAARSETTVRALAALNGITNPNVLSVGRTLSIPGGAPAPAAATPTSSGDVAALIARHAARYGVDPALARAVAWQESRWTQSARSHAGAIGVMQLMPGTARWLGPAVIGRPLDPHDLADNIEGGVAYLGWLTRQSGDARTAVGAYYQGLDSLRRIGPYDDTRDYVASVLSFVGRV
ncbi:LysM peptidoglycan-binding domain-containing protein [Miltoncostaea marina]|uniref:LysM peptidoglycan-binding domain-containing protein n=1 Tax=Miltoncostaea marina TaxID=2843215 RepID=UPI001C3DCC57|nr:LysM peptidoglycan-binding domain-containing protein [Miltoncostaea marina]